MHCSDSSKINRTDDITKRERDCIWSMSSNIEQSHRVQEAHLKIQCLQRKANRCSSSDSALHDILEITLHFFAEIIQINVIVHSTNLTMHSLIAGFNLNYLP